MTTKSFQDLLRLSERQITAIADELRQADSNREGRQDRRISKRLPFFEEAVLLFQLKQIRAENTPFLVRCVDVSAGGIGLLHGAFVHGDTPCEVTLVVRKKMGFRLKGKVARCHLHRGHVHVLGVKFDEPLSEAQIKSLRQTTAGNEGVA